MSFVQADVVRDEKLARSGVVAQAAKDRQVGPNCQGDPALVIGHGG